MAGIFSWLQARFERGRPDPFVEHLENLDRFRVEAAAALPFERIETTGEKAFATWDALRGAGRGWPIVVGGDDDLGLLAEGFASDATPPEAILATADTLQMPAALAELRADEAAQAIADGAEPTMSAEIGTWPDAPPPPTGLTVASDHKGKPLDKVHILLIPARTSTEVPAYLRYGGWNECPGPAEHVAALRDWDARYGLELIGMSHDVLNLRVARPPATREAALELAREHFAYCEDIVLQGTETLSNLAASLMAHDSWYFWWD